MHKLKALLYLYGLIINAVPISNSVYYNFFSSSHLEGYSTSVGRPGNWQSPVLAIENVDGRQRILFYVSPDGVHVT